MRGVSTQIVRWSSATVGLSALMAVSCASVTFALAPTAAFGSRPGSTCPAAPIGWKAASSTPQWPASQWPVNIIANINCSYINSEDRVILVTAEFARPADINPLENFYFGCGTNGDVAWNGTGREYLISSSDRWLYAGFSDPAHVLNFVAVTRFERVARSLLQVAESLAHICQVTTTPIPIKSG